MLVEANQRRREKKSEHEESNANSYINPGNPNNNGRAFEYLTLNTIMVLPIFFFIF